MKPDTITAEDLLSAAREAGENVKECGSEAAPLWAITHAVYSSVAAICQRLDVLIQKSDQAGWRDRRVGP